MASIDKTMESKNTPSNKKQNFKVILSRVYGWGAAIVILGALFKINHYPYADQMLLVGLGTEAIIFFLSGFEKPHFETDWSIVYPELKNSQLGSHTPKVTQQLDTLLKDANVDEHLIGSLASGLRNLSDTTSKLKDVSNASLATNEYVDKMRSATSSVNELSNAYKKTSESLDKDVRINDEFSTNVKQASYQISELSKSYSNASESLKSDVSSVNEFSETVKNANDSAKGLIDNYKRSSDIISKSAEALDFSDVDGAKYNQQLKKISETMSSLNQLYEMQLQSSNQQVESSNKLHETMNKFLSNLSESADKMITYKNNMDELNEKMGALNNVYGGMLSAMNPNKSH